MNQVELNKKVAKALTESNDFEKTEEIVSEELILNDNVIVLIENIWIKKNINLSSKIILDNIDKILEDNIINKLDNEENEYFNIDNNKIDIENNKKKGIIDYNLKDLINKFENNN
ncbi:hypothetical protein Glove_467g2 [Diversispora epigaea]|uniref:Uncharacterized protein n=1 Tax=Diversispora epigaea TaxID=1348612 RepID=A0A397GNW3_9GLOM|nr:hypothetical protein Glove_467g2 [Diversispora epigaea]